MFEGLSQNESGGLLFSRVFVSLRQMFDEWRTMSDMHKQMSGSATNTGNSNPPLSFCDSTSKNYNGRFPSSQNATALAAATFSESTLWDMGIFTV